MGHMVPSTLKIIGSINGQEMIVLVDGGSTNNFLQSCLAIHLNQVIQPSSHRCVTIVNSKTLTCGSESSGVLLRMGEATFIVDLLLLPIYGANVVLGVQLLRHLGTVLFDYDKLWMEFQHNASWIRLHRLTQP